ncbi:MAG: CvpA family protein [Proteobacteria bacterium]|nr:CvpA family protein [Pseudomonadota bacterium]
MNPLDMIIVVIMAFCLIRGLFRGFVKEISSIIGVMAGYYAAYTYYPDLSDYLSGLMSSGKIYMNVLSFLVLFCGIYLIISLLGVLIKFIMKIAYLGWVDRILGTLFGGIKGILIVSVILIGLATLLPRDTSLIRTSVLSKHVAKVSVVMIRAVPDEMKREFGERLKKLKESWGDRLVDQAKVAYKINKDLK